MQAFICHACGSRAGRRCDEKEVEGEDMAHLYEKSTFQYKVRGVPVITVIGAITFGIGFWMMCNVGLELTSQWSMILVSGLLLLGLILVAWMYNQNRKEGIDPNMIFTQIPPA